MGFGIAEAGVVLDHARSGGREHDADKKGAAKRDALGGDGVDGRANDFVFDAREQRGRHDLGGRIGAHAAGVGAGIALSDTFVVLRGGKDDVVAAGDDDEDAGFFTEEAVFDEQLAARGAEFIAGEHFADGGLGLGERLGHDDAFARGEAIGFDDDRDRACPQVSERRLNRIKKRRGRSWDAVLEENFFGENFRGFEARAVGAGTVNGNAEGAQAVGEAEREWDLGTDDDEGDVFALHERDEAGDVVGGNREARGFLGDAGVTGCANHARGGGRGEERTDERVFASAGADDEKRAGESGKRRHGKRKKGV